MNSAFCILRGGVLDHLITGRLGFFELGLYVIVHLQADFRTGIWWGSAPKLHASAPAGTSLREVQRGLQRLAKIGFLRPFHKHGARGNYPVLINKYDIKVGALKGKRLNAWESESWKNPRYAICTQSNAEPVTVPVAEAAPIQDSVDRTHEKEKQQPSKTAQAPSEKADTLASLLRQRILENNPAAKITDNQKAKWAREADLMMLCDRRTEAQIRELIEWSQKDSFWLSNILSMRKLREKFDQLTLKMRSNGGGNGTNVGNHRGSGAVSAPSTKYSSRKPDFTVE